MISKNPLNPRSSLLLGLLLALGGCADDSDHAARPLPQGVCPMESEGGTSDGDPVTICEQIFEEAPFVHLPKDDRKSSQQTIHGVIELDIENADSAWSIGGARLIDSELEALELVDGDGKPLDETSPLMADNHLPSNRVHYLLYEAKGKKSGTTFQLSRLRPIVMVTGHALDGRFLGAWEGTMSGYTGDGNGDDSWSTDDNVPVRLEMVGLTEYDNIAEIVPVVTPPLADGTRFKAVGGVVNGPKSVKLSTGQCIPALTSYGERNPLLIATDYDFALWRYPAMHTAGSGDFHIVNDYPKYLYTQTIGMAPIHNFRLPDYVSPKTTAQDLRFIIHGTPFNQLEFTIKQVRGGGEDCTP